jgi:hypothetical protein
VSVSKLARHDESPGRAFSARAHPAGRFRVAHAAVEGFVRSGGGVPTAVGGSGVWLVIVTGGPGFAATGAELPVQPYPMPNTPTASTADPATAFQRAVRAVRGGRALTALTSSSTEEGGSSIDIRSWQVVAPTLQRKR